MSYITLKTTKQTEEAAEFIASSILNQLRLGNHVLFFMPGGSGIDVAIKVSIFIREHAHKNLTITLTDERYGKIGHPDSNWYQLMRKGFDLKEAKFIPILVGEDIEATTQRFNSLLKEELKLKQYKIGFFGIGKDGHTAGILPNSKAIDSKGFVSNYDTPTYSRITTTFNLIEKLDEAVVWAEGENKWPIIKNLLEEEISTTDQPAQILKKVPILTIFTDYNPSSRAQLTTGQEKI